MHKIKVIQFLPYFPPHKGGLETVAEEFSQFYVKSGFGDVINIIFDVGQDISEIEEKFLIKNEKGSVIGYFKNGYKVYLLPSFDIISNFPVPKFWKKMFWEILFLKELRYGIIQTHTRFFLSSFLGGIFAKYHKLKWVHVEHGSDYVKLSSAFKSKIAYFYDKIFGKWIFKKADKIIAISEGVKKFIEKEFVKRDLEVIYNGIDFTPVLKKENDGFIRIGFVGRLVKLKGIDLLIQSFQKLEKKYENIFLEIVGDGEEREYLEGFESNKIKFLGGKTRDEVKEFLATCDILVNPSFQEGLPTTVLEGLLSKCVVVATDAGGTKEISDKNDLIIVEKGSVESIQNGFKIAISDYKNISGKSYNFVKETFDWNQNIKKYFSLYSKLGK